MSEIFIVGCNGQLGTDCMSVFGDVAIGFDFLVAPRYRKRYHVRFRLNIRINKCVEQSFTNEVATR